MILFESNNKITFIIILAVIGSVIVINQWLKTKPLANNGAIESNVFWQEIKEGTSSRVNDLVDGMQLGWLQLKDFEETVEKENKQNELVKATKEYIAYNQTYDNQVDCEEAGGTWGMFGAFAIEKCRIATSDGGKECSDSSECQSSCIVTDWPEIYQMKWSQGESVAMTGTCNDSNLLVGCFAFVEEGLVKGAVCE